MKNLILLFCAMMIAGMSYGQLKIISTGFAGFNESNPPERITLTTTGAPANFLVRRSDSGNFIKAVGGLNGAAYFFKKENFYAITPGDDQADQSTDFANAIVLYGANHASYPGRVGIGTQAPTHKLHVQGDIKYTGALVPSDKNLKSNISSFDAGINELMELKPIIFEYNGKGGTIEGDKHVGILAQDLQKAVPFLVDEYQHDTYDNHDVGTENPKLINSENFLEIKDNEIKYLMINAIKDQQELIEAQGKQIAELEDKINELEVTNKNVVLDFKSNGDLGQNRPNPFSGSTMIDYFVPEKSSSAKMNIVGMNGQVLKTVDLDHTGQGQLTISAEELPAGSYAYELIVDGQRVNTKKMIKQ